MILEEVWKNLKDSSEVKDRELELGVRSHEFRGVQ